MLSDQEVSFLEPSSDSAAPVAQPEHPHGHAATSHESERASEPGSSTVPTAEAQAELSRQNKMAHTRLRKMQELFEHRKYAILGEIRLEEDEQFQTPFGNRGRHGYVLQELVEGRPTSHKIVVGHTILHKASVLYDAIEGMDPAKPKRTRRTRQEVAEERARKAAEAAANQAHILARFEQQLNQARQQAAEESTSEQHTTGDSVPEQHNPEHHGAEHHGAEHHNAEHHASEHHAPTHGVEHSASPHDAMV